MKDRKAGAAQIKLGTCATAFAMLVPAPPAAAQDWWIISSGGDRGQRVYAFADKDSVTSFDNPDPEGSRRLAAIEVTIVNEAPRLTIEERTYGYQVDCAARRLRVTVLQKHPPVVGRTEGGVFRQRREGAPSVTLANVRQAAWEEAKVHYLSQAVDFACSPEKRTDANFMLNVPETGRGPAGIANYLWEDADERMMREWREKGSPK